MTNPNLKLKLMARKLLKCQLINVWNELKKMKREDVGWKRKIGKRRRKQTILKKKQRGTSLD